jgi:hypothetical protein
MLFLFPLLLGEGEGEALKHHFQLTKVFPLPSPCRGGSGRAREGGWGLGSWKLLVSSNTFQTTSKVDKYPP